MHIKGKVPVVTGARGSNRTRKSGRMGTGSRWLLLLSLGVWPAGLTAQAPAVPATAADSALAACLSGASVSPSDRASLNDRAERLWRAAVALQPEGAAPSVGLARVLVQCRLPLATGPAEMLGLFQEAVDALRGALDREPGYWPARFTLGLVYAGAPEFLGHTNSGIAELELATGAGGIPEHLPEFREALQELARLFDRTGRAAEASAVRDRAARLPARDRLPPPRDDGSPPREPDTMATVAGITVTASSRSDAVESRAGRAVTALDVVTMPGGAADLMQVLQVLPGVTGGSESSDLSLRGGDPSEAPVFLNGARLAYAGKFESLSGGLFGVLDPDVLRSVHVYAAAFSARYGDALSGVIDAVAVGRPAARSRRIALNTAGPAVTVMEPRGDGAGVWGSARFTHTSLMLRMHGRGEDYAADPVSLEGIAGATGRTDRGEFRAVALVEHDDASPLLTVAGHRGPYRSSGTTVATVLSARLDRVGPVAAIRATGTFSSRASDVAFGALDVSRRLRRGGLRVEGDVPVSGRALLTTGLEVSRLGAVLEGTVPVTAEFATGAPIREMDGTGRRASHAGGFSEVLLVPAGWLTVTSGLRLDRLPGERGLTVDPRLAAEATFGRYTVSVAGGVFQQGPFRPARQQPGLDERTGVARRARHLLVGVERRGAVTLGTDLYVKHYQRWVGGDSVWTPTGGTVVGGDVFLSAPGYRRGAHVTYSAMRARLSLPDGTSIPAAYDVGHSLVAVIAQRIGTAWDVGATLRLAAGRPYSPLLSQDTSGGVASLALGAPNSERYPVYRRVDARVSRYIRRGSRLLVAFAELLNLEGRGNIVGYGVQSATGRGEPITTFYGRRTMIVGVELR